MRPCGPTACSRLFSSLFFSSNKMSSSIHVTTPSMMTCLLRRLVFELVKETVEEEEEEEEEETPCFNTLGELEWFKLAIEEADEDDDGNSGGGAGWCVWINLTVEVVCEWVGDDSSNDWLERWCSKREKGESDGKSEEGDGLRLGARLDKEEEEEEERCFSSKEGKVMGMMEKIKSKEKRVAIYDELDKQIR